MDIIKTAALTSLAIVACLMLLLTPDSYRDGAPTGDALSLQQELAPINQQQADFRIEREQPAVFDSDATPPIRQDKPDSMTDSPQATQAVNWSTILYPELPRIEALENEPANRALIELMPMLSSDDPVIRLAAIESVGDINNQVIVPVLAAALNDPNPQLRVAAIEALASQEDATLAGSIEPYLYDPEREVRLAAIEAIAELEYESSVYALAGLLSDPDSRIRARAVQALGEIGGESAMLYLEQARYDPDEAIRVNAEDILSELGS